MLVLVAGRRTWSESLQDLYGVRSTKYGVRHTYIFRILQGNWKSWGTRKTKEELDSINALTSTKTKGKKPTLLHYTALSARTTGQSHWPSGTLGIGEGRDPHKLVHTWRRPLNFFLILQGVQLLGKSIRSIGWNCFSHATRTVIVNIIDSRMQGTRVRGDSSHYGVQPP